MLQRDRQKGSWKERWSGEQTDRWTDRAELIGPSGTAKGPIKFYFFHRNEYYKMSLQWYKIRISIFIIKQWYSYRISHLGLSDLYMYHLPDVGFYSHLELHIFRVTSNSKEIKSKGYQRESSTSTPRNIRM